MDIIPKMPGVYLLINKINGKKYVGESINLFIRIRSYKNLYNRKLRKYPTLIERSIKKYGWSNFDVKILKIVYNEDFYKKSQIKNFLLYIESKLIIENSSLYPNGYNLCRYGRGHAGINRTKGYRKRQSESSKKQNYNKWKISVKQIDKNSGKIIKVWDSAKEASIGLIGNNNLRGPISMVCNKKTFINENGYRCLSRTAGGFYWEFATDKPRYSNE